ncbi:hypothetical protein BGZ73_001026 [Actinomortierella ambigua]|nr:hypothetical protein BGZ73_001026 [Actinomortierella ambigua]
MLVITLIAILNQFMRLPSEMDADQHLHREHASRLFTAVFGSKGSRDDRNDNHGDGTVAAVEISVGDAGQSGGRRRGRSSATANGEGSSRRNIDPATMISLAPGEDEEDDGQVDPYEDDDQGADDEAYDIDDEQRAMLRRNERTYGSTASC